MKTIFKVLSLLFIIGCLCSCKKKEETLSSDAIVIAKAVKVINNETWNKQFISLDSTNYTITFSKNITSTLQIKVGDIIVSEAGEGLLRKVKSVSTVGNETKVQTESATLTDVIQQGLIEYDQPLTISQIKSIDYNYAGLKLKTDNSKGAEQTQFSWDINAVLYDNDGNLATTSDQIKLIGTFNCDWRLALRIDVGLSTGLKEVKFGYESSENLDLQLIAGIQYSFEKKITLATVNFTPIVVTIGFVPIVFTPQLKISVGIDGSANASVTSKITQSISFNAGIQYLKDQDWSPYNTFDKNIGFQPPQLNMNASTSAYLKPELLIKVYAIAGPYANLKLYGRVDANLLQTPWWKLYGGITMSAGAKVDILDKFLLECTVSDLIKYEQLLAQSTTPPVLLPIVTTNNVTTFTSTTATYGGNVTSDGNASISDRGVYYGTSANPETTGTKLQIGSGTGSFSYTRSGLSANTTYYVKAYAINSRGPAYGSQVTFTTLPSNVLSGKISGIVRNAVTSNPLPGVAATVFMSSTTIGTASSQSDGLYEIIVPANTGYKVVFSKQGYLSAEYQNVNVTVNGNTVLEPILQIDQTYAGNGNISGTIKNALNGTGISGVSLSMRNGINVTSGTIISSKTTGSSGEYAFNSIPAGNYTIQATNSNYNTTYFTVLCLGGQTTANQNATMSPILVGGATRIVLTWGASPSDLDSHFTGPLANGTRFHMYYLFSEGDSPWPNIVLLDLDDVDSYGPETTTLLQQIAGVYRFSVHDYSNKGLTSSNALSNSGAQVRVYQNSGLVATFNVPPNTGGTLWTVFEMNGTTITTINQMNYVTDPSVVTKSRYINPDAGLFWNLPKK